MLHEQNIYFSYCIISVCYGLNTPRTLYNRLQVMRNILFIYVFFLYLLVLLFFFLLLILKFLLAYNVSAWFTFLSLESSKLHTNTDNLNVNSDFKWCSGVYVYPWWFERKQKSEICSAVLLSSYKIYQKNSKIENVVLVTIWENWIVT